MTADGGGWTRIFGSLYPTFWAFLSWQAHGESYDDYSALNPKQYFTDMAGRYTFRFKLETVETGTRRLPLNKSFGHKTMIRLPRLPLV